WTDERGYADQLYDLLRPRFNEFRLVKLGCSGETTESLISGIDSPCTYPSGSQLKEATKFLQAHSGQVKFITIDIGGNDAVFVGGCWDPIQECSTLRASRGSCQTSRRSWRTSST